MIKNFRYDGTFSDHILVLGQTGCAKTSFIQSLGKNKVFGSDLLSIIWVSKINLLNNREDEIRQCFSYTKVEFHYPNGVEGLNLIIETFQKETYDEDKKTNDKCNVFGENKKLDQFIVMDDILGLAEKSNDFANFLTVSRKFSYICLYIFHIICPTRLIWQMILFQTKIFNIFISTIQSGNILKTLTSNCDRETINYTPPRNLWINRLYMPISNKLNILA